MSDHASVEPSRRAVLRGGAIGAGALLGAIGLGAGNSAAAAQVVPAQAPALDAVTTGDRLFLKLDGIAGDSMLKGFEDWIELSEFSWGAENMAAGRGGRGRGPGRLRSLDGDLSAPTSQASPLLLKSAVTGKVISSGQVVVTRATEGGLAQFIKLALTDVLVDSYKIDVTTGGLPTDSAQLRFQRITFSYYPQGPDGAMGSPVVVQWDTETIGKG